MVDKIIELDDNQKYLILDETVVDNKKYYYALGLDEQERVANNYLFFEELEDKKSIIPVSSKEVKDMLLTTFTINYLDKVYGEVNV